MQNKMTEIFSKFGKIGVIVYFSLFFLTFFGFYCAIHYGVDIKSWKYFDKLAVAGSVGLAYAATKITQPIRIGLTLAIVSLLAIKEEQPEAEKTPAESEENPESVDGEQRE